MKRKKNILTWWQLKQLLNLAKQENESLFVALTLSMYGFCRLQEVIGIQRDDVESSGIYIKRKKQRHKRLVYFPVPVMRIVQNYLEIHTQQRLLTVRDKSRPLTGRTLALWVQQLGNRFGVRHLTITNIRASVATILNAQGVPVAEIQGLMDHRSKETSCRYYIAGEANRNSSIDKLNLL